MRLRIREFEKPDLDTLWRIDQACFDAQLAYSRTELALYMRRPGSFTLVAEGESGEVAGNGKVPASILGFIVAETRRKSGHIITIDVVAEARRAGVGSALLGAAEQELRRAGAVAVDWRSEARPSFVDLHSHDARPQIARHAIFRHERWRRLSFMIEEEPKAYGQGCAGS